jgi:hypothetical protein
LDATVDDVMFVSRALESHEVKLLASAMPCATGYRNQGYAYFPDTPALHGPEYVLWDNVPACGKAGPPVMTLASPLHSCHLTALYCHHRHFVIPESRQETTQFIPPRNSPQVEHTVKWTTTSVVRPCGEGPHTVTFRYLQSMGNNKHMLLGGRGGDTPVHFHEPDSFASADTFTWAHTDPVGPGPAEDSAYDTSSSTFQTLVSFS